MLVDFTQRDNTAPPRRTGTIRLTVNTTGQGKLRHQTWPWLACPLIQVSLPQLDEERYVHALALLPLSNGLV